MTALYNLLLNYSSIKTASLSFFQPNCRINACCQIILISFPTKGTSATYKFRFMRTLRPKSNKMNVFFNSFKSDTQYASRRLNFVFFS